MVLVKTKIAWAALWLLLLGLAVAWRVQNLNSFGLSNDEGVYLMWGRLVADGYPLYRDTVAVQPPLFFETLALAFRLFGDTLLVGRWTMLAGFGLLAAGLSWLAYQTGRWPAAISALVLLALAPLVFTFSRLAMAEIPATALAVLAIALLVVYTRRPHWGWLVASGLLLGLSLIFKTLNPFVVAPAAVLLMLHHTLPQQVNVAAQLVSPHKHWRRLLLDGAAWGAAAALPVALVFVLYDSATAYDQLVVFRNDLRAAVPGSWPETWDHFALFFAGHWSFWLLAIGSIISTTWQAARFDGKTATSPLFPKILCNFVWLVWLLSGVLLLVWHTPLFAHHFVVLLPPLILLGAGFVADAISLWPAASLPLRLGLALPLLVAALGVPAMVQTNRQTVAAVTGGREQDALAFLDTVTNPNDFVMGDSQLLIFMANRRTPPPLGDLALVGIKAGRQTADRLVRLTTDYRSPAVVQWALRLPWLPDYLTWVEQNYLARRVWDNDHIIYFVRRIPPDEPLPNPQNVPLGDSLALRGFSIDPNPARPGQALQLSVYWQTAAPLAEDYTIFTQLLDSTGALAAGFDHQPLGGNFPTSQWPAGEIVTDRLRLPLPAELPPGRYTLVTGMYRLSTGERLPVAGGPGDSVVLSRLDVK